MYFCLSLRACIYKSYNKSKRMRNFKNMGRDYKQKQQQTNQVRYESGMTSQQKYNSIAESVLGSMSYTSENVKGCPMHPKISKKCRKCQEIQSKIQTIEINQQVQLDQSFPELIKINTNNLKSHFSEKLQNNVENAALFKSKLKAINNVRELVNDLTSDEISIDTYTSNSTQNPTVFFTYFYRLSELRPTRQQLSIMLRANNVNVRCMALLYLRVFADPSIVYGCLNGSFNDNKLLNVETIGEYAMRLLDEEKLDHGGFRLPRLPIKIQREITKRVSKIKEERQKQMDKEFERERQRSREKQVKRREAEDQQYEKRMQQKLKRFEHSPKRQPKEEEVSQPAVKLSLKEKIKLIEEKKAQQARRQAILDEYKTEKVDKLDSQEEANSQNDDIEKFHMG